MPARHARSATPLAGSPARPLFGKKSVVVLRTDRCDPTDRRVQQNERYRSACGRVEETVDIGDRPRQRDNGSAERINRGQRSRNENRTPRLPLPVNVSRPSVIPAAPVRWSGETRTDRSRHRANDAKRCVQPPHAAVGDEVRVINLHPSAIGCDRERSAPHRSSGRSHSSLNPPTGARMHRRLTSRPAMPVSDDCFSRAKEKRRHRRGSAGPTPGGGSDCRVPRQRCC